MDITALFQLSYGLYVVSAKSGDKLNGQIANTAMQVSAEPPKLMVCLNKNNLTHEMIMESKVFAVSVLEQSTPMQFIGHFGFKSGRELDKLATVDFSWGQTGAPLITPHALSVIECRMEGHADVGTHTIFFGEIIDAQNLKPGKPLTYAYYHQVKNGLSPKSAPVSTAPAVAADTVKKIDKPERFRCRRCGYIYDPQQGDPQGGINPRTDFKDLPETWTCPVCGADKSEFESVESSA